MNDKSHQKKKKKMFHIFLNLSELKTKEKESY